MWQGQTITILNSSESVSFIKTKVVVIWLNLLDELIKHTQSSYKVFTRLYTKQKHFL